MNKSVSSNNHLASWRESFKEWISKSHSLVAGAIVAFIVISVFAVLTVIMYVIPTLIFFASAIAIMWVIGHVIKDSIKGKEILRKLKERENNSYTQTI